MLGIFCDFDGTITSLDVTDAVLERFADPQWLQIQEDWLAGRLTARQVLQMQMPLIDAGPQDVEAFVGSIDLDPFFAEFVLACVANQDRLYILSDGFDYWIEKVLDRSLAGMTGLREKIDVFSCALKFERKGVAISFPHFPEGCEHGCATCKVGLLNRLRNGVEKTVAIGDGKSDFLMARAADVVLAKNGLEQYCRGEGIAYSPYRDFRDVALLVEQCRGNGSGRLME